MDNQPEQPEPAEHPTEGTRGADGRYTRNIQTAQRDAEAARLRSRGWSYRRIATELDLTVSNAHTAVQRALKATVEEPAQDVRQLELDRLDTLWEAAQGVLERRHVHVSGGGVVLVRVLENGKPVVVDHDGDGKPIYKETELEDDAPVLKAVETLLKIQARRAALLGLDAPIKADIGGQLTYEIIGVDMEQL